MSNGRKFYTVRVYNKNCDRVDIHKNLSYDEVEYLKFMYFLEVEITEVSFSRRTWNNKS